MRGAVDADGQAFDDEVGAVDGAGEDERVVVDVEEAGEGGGFVAEEERDVECLRAVFEEG